MEAEAVRVKSKIARTDHERYDVPYVGPEFLRELEDASGIVHPYAYVDAHAGCGNRNLLELLKRVDSVAVHAILAECANMVGGLNGGTEDRLLARHLDGFEHLKLIHGGDLEVGTEICQGLKHLRFGISLHGVVHDRIREILLVFLILLDNP